MLYAFVRVIHEKIGRLEPFKPSCNYKAPVLRTHKIETKKRSDQRQNY
jgi:hypothetical protein